MRELLTSKEDFDLEIDTSTRKEKIIQEKMEEMKKHIEGLEE